MKLRDVHVDMERYLSDDCYCPGEIYDSSGFFFRVYGVDDECAVIEHSDDMTAVIAKTCSNGKDDERPQAIMFWHDEGDGRIIDAERFDATENNVGILKTIVQGGEPDGRKIDEFDPGSLQRALNKVMSIADAVMVD